MKLIDADKLKKDVLDLQDCYNGFSDTYDKACIIGVIDEQPSVQSERKKGEWILSPDDSEGVCNVCHYKIHGRFYQGHYLIVPYNYCPNCGADMRGENNG